MKRAVGHLIPFIEEEKRLSGSTADDNAGVIIMATVKARRDGLGCMGVQPRCETCCYCGLLASALCSVCTTATVCMHTCCIPHANSLPLLHDSSPLG